MAESPTRAGDNAVPVDTLCDLLSTEREHPWWSAYFHPSVSTRVGTSSVDRKPIGHEAAQYVACKLGDR
ncbi:hypothetical protein CN207_33030 [Sinorhizobium meliloti]|nr:hypothetical protein CN207_33030 [Sinorhizobium meliloti]